LLKLSLCPDSKIRDKKKNQAPLAPPSGPIGICRNTPLPVRNNQSEPGGMS